MPDEIRPEHDQPEPRSALAEIERLQSDRAHRDARRTFFVEGVRNIVQAIENGFRLEALISSDPLLTVPIARELVRDRRRSGVPTLRGSPEAFCWVSRTHHASGVGQCPSVDVDIAGSSSVACSWSSIRRLHQASCPGG